jgi:hypothetical protein
MAEWQNGRKAKWQWHRDVATRQMGSGKKVKSENGKGNLALPQNGKGKMAKAAKWRRWIDTSAIGRGSSVYWHIGKGNLLKWSCKCSNVPIEAP